MVEALDEPVQQGVSRDDLPHLDLDDALVELYRVADAVDAADGGHDDDIAPSAEQGRGGRQAQLLDLLVDGEVLLDVGAARWDVRLGLVIVVVADEVLDEVVRKELLELAVQLGGEGLVVAQDQRGPLTPLDDIGDGERLAGPRHPEQGLVRKARIQSFDELSDGFGLIAGGLEFTVEIERRHGQGPDTKKGGIAPFCLVSSPKGRKSYSATTSKVTSAETSLWSFTVAV